MIKRIVMSNVASFPASGEAVMDNMDKVVLVYGANGSGKSTLARFVGDPALPLYSDCAIDADGDALPCVFDRTYKQKQFQSDALSGIFTLGSASIELQRELSALEDERGRDEDRLSSLREDLDAIKNAKAKCEDTFAKTLHKDLCKAYCDEYPDIFKGFKSSKEKFAALMLEVYGDGLSSTRPLAELAEKYRLLFDEAGDGGCERLPQFSSEFAALAASIEDSDIWQKAVMGREDLPVSKHISKLGNQDWVRRGMAYIEGDVCPFCGRHSLDGKFLKQLDEYFDGSFVKATDAIASFKAQYENFAKYVRGFMNGLSEYAESLRIAGIEQKRLDALKASVQTVIDLNLSQIAQKAEHPSKPVTLQSSEACLNDLCLALLDANRKIASFNEMCAFKKREQTALRQEFHRYLASTKKDAIKAHLEKTAALDDRISAQNAAVNDAKSRLDATEARIADIKQQLSGIAPSADRINAALNAHGFHGFRLKAEESAGTYSIVREDGSNALHTLSEGEEMFVTFLYFVENLKSELGKEFVGRTVVLDDPVSGLDSETLAIVAKLTSDLAYNARDGRDGVDQLIVLTHSRDYLAQIFAPDDCTKRFSITKRNSSSRIIPLG